MLENRDIFKELPKNTTLMLVEDNMIIRETLIFFLEKMKVVVFSYDNGEDALKNIEEMKPTVLVTDYHLAGEMRGDALIRNVQQTAHIPRYHILSSAGSTTEATVQLKKEGVPNLHEINKSSLIEFYTQLLAIIRQ